ncbi:CD63 antigen [Octopus bimaculoides]|uniref:Tetraspanin n=1 Tax=Octopus bimaculoides TaxID=37653 RepID=A0A0L8HEP9_OCTBM|nr:CD63 antigen [Octopus bimaculoides]|eukprot:XP_014772953.1 PREDICTED: CD63 antigen-like [Octopus bimaculoides]
MATIPAESVKQWTRNGMRCCFGVLSCVLLCGAVFTIAFGVVIQMEYGGPINTFGGHFQLFSILLLCSGTLYFLLAMFGIGSLILNSSKGLSIMTYFVLILAIVQIFTGMVGIGAKGYVHGEINKRMKSAQMNYLKNPTSQIAWNTTQREMICCGIYSSSEWFRVLGDHNLPDSCCIYKSPGCGLQAIAQSNYYNDGCLRSYVSFTNLYQFGISIYCLLSNFLHLFLIAIPIYLIQKLEEYDKL